ncbi:kinesin-like protein KIF9 isoform X2 [Electrophorus electricus]|uniref:kinesin-like protein KIF9 isoform X2 n=1 Tax=Electrophorus electricus TaxID=8005 RepID=UPI0015CFBE2E|nr:kinesin-like protein KIF9 isoform X2 [Electrophorus electricus]
MNVNSNEVKVYVRTRPTACFAQDLIEYLPDKQTVNVHQRRCSRRGVVNNQTSSWSFRLNGVLHSASQEEVYEHVAHTVVLSALQGYNGTIMCFGQTGAGKTYTITGATEAYRQRGIIPRALQEVFREVEHRVGHTFSLHLSYLEIYNETLLDLLASIKGSQEPQGGPLTVVEEPGGGVLVKGLSLHPVHSEEEALNLLFEGEMNRIIGEHALNKNSSRSHCIFTIHIESRSRTLSNATYVTSKLNLVDLAGSERLSKTGSEGQVQREAMYINRSLSFLEQAIMALADRRREHVPFRQSKLTHALRDSLGGNCNTVLVANIYGEAAHIEETLSTLRFAARMKCVRTEPSVNEHMDPALQVHRLKKEIQQLKQELSIQDTLANRAGVSYEKLSESQVAEVRSQVQRYLAGTLDEITIVNARQIQEVFAQFKKIVQEQQQLGQKHTLVEKVHSMSSSSAAKAREPEGAVGELEGGFGLGVAAPSQRHTPSPSRSKGKKAKDSSRKNGKSCSPTEGPAVAQKEPEAPLATLDPEGLEPLPVKDTGRKRSATPPSKMEAFEHFKAERGSELKRILKANKAVLLERSAQLHKLTDAINATKRDIDKVGSELEHLRAKRQSQGQFVSAEGEPVLEEAELALVLSLREMKDNYRQAHDELLATRAEVRYCQHLVAQCRVRLLTDEVLSILREGPIRPGLVPVDKALALEGEAQEHADLLSDSPSAVWFHNAQNRTLQRRGSRPVPHSPDSRKNGTGTRRNKLKLPAVSVSRGHSSNIITI